MNLLTTLLTPLLRFAARKNLPKRRGTVHLPGLGKDVRVRWDPYAIPYIFAENEADLFFAQGYLHAQDRLWQMDLNRRVFSGRLAGDPRRPANPPRGLLTAPPIRQHGRRRPLHAGDGPPPYRGALPAPAVGAVRPSRGSLLRRRQRLHRGTPAPPAGGVPRAALRTRPVAAGGLPHPGQGVRPVPVVRPDDAAHLSSTPCTFARTTPTSFAPWPRVTHPGAPPSPAPSATTAPRCCASSTAASPTAPWTPRGQGSNGWAVDARHSGGPCDPVQRHAPPHDGARHLVSEPPADGRRFRRDANLRGRGRVAAGISLRLRRAQPGHGLGIRRRPVR